MDRSGEYIEVESLRAEAVMLGRVEEMETVVGEPHNTEVFDDNGQRIWPLPNHERGTAVTEIDLKPCPFCGSKAEVYKSILNYPASFTIACTGKTCCAQLARYNTLEGVVRDWNRRAPLPPETCGG